MKRIFTQILGLVIPNGYIKVFWSGASIYQGRLKGVCLPILNCYACPSAYVSCPIGAIQHFFAIKAFPFYVLGLLGITGLGLGRWPCGWICPFGFFQDILHKISKKLKIPQIKKVPKFLKYVKYMILVGFVILIPLLTTSPLFCKVCPMGSLEGGIPQVVLHEQLRPLIGILYWSKIAILALLIILMFFIERVFCRILCPLGATLGLFNKTSLLQLSVDEEQCNKCQKCYLICPMGVKIYENPKDENCIRCMKCVNSCPAITKTTMFTRIPELQTEQVP
ncbi:4Fe-4S binding protein [bacterium]|nr:4Fe-4S binding protein [bacterium]